MNSYGVPYKAVGSTDQPGDVSSGDFGGTGGTGGTGAGIGTQTGTDDLIYKQLAAALYNTDGTPKTYRSPYQDQLDEIQKQMDAIIAADPFKGQTIAGIRSQMEAKYGRDAILAKATLAQQQLDNMNKNMELIGADIKNNPNLTKSLAAKRYEYASEKQLAFINAKQREIDGYNKQLTDVEKNITNAMNDSITQYNVYKDQRDSLQSRFDKIETKIGKVSDDARAVFNTILADPALVKGITDNEIKYIQQNGIYPASLIYKIGQNAGFKVKSVFSSQTGPNQETVYGVDENGNVKILSVQSNYPVGGGSGSTPNMQYKDVTDPVTGKITREYFYEPTTPGTMTFQGEPTAAQKKANFVNFTNTYTGDFTEAQYTELANLLGLSVEDTAVKSAISKGDMWTGVNIFGTRNPDVQGTYSKFTTQSTGGTTSGSTGGAIPKGTDGALYGKPGYVSDGTQWVLK
jgi:Holliday junction resolvase-like predicted endonuclease